MAMVRKREIGQDVVEKKENNKRKRKFPLPSPLRILSLSSPTPYFVVSLLFESKCRIMIQLSFDYLMYRVSPANVM